MSRSTRSLLDLLQDSLGIKAKINLNQKLNRYKGSEVGIDEQLLKMGSNEEEGGKRSRWNQRESDNSICASKISQIAYNIRKDERDFDKAFLLEQLTEQLLQRRSCVLAFKCESQDGQVSCYDAINQIIPLRNNSNLIEFLILLSSPSQEYQISEFGTKFIKSQMRKAIAPNEKLLPQSQSYCQSDAPIMQRDKSTNIRYVHQDNTTFENIKLSNQVQDLSFNELLTSSNRFNAILKGLDKEKTSHPEPLNATPFMGALTRLQPTGLFGQSSSEINPFNITFELPPLPSMESLQQDEDAYDQFNFFTQMKSSNQKHTEEAKPFIQPQRVSPDNKQSQINKRQKKQKEKKANKRAVLWSLMPYVDESLLRHNMEAECGIVNLWEDEQLDIKMNNLQVQESGLLTQYKITEFNSDYDLYSAGIIKVPGSKTFTEEELVQSAILMLQGVPSTIFQLQQDTMTFILRENVKVENHAFNQALLQSTFEEMIEAGSYFLHLKEFSSFLANPSYECGQILENFAMAISDFLAFYQNQVNDLESQIQTRRQIEEICLFDSSDDGLGLRKTTILELRIHMGALITQIKLLASICFTKKFIEGALIGQDFDGQDAIFKKQKIYNSSNLRSLFSENIEKIKTKQWLLEFPKGPSLLTYLYKIILCCESDLQSIDLLRRIFQQTIDPLLKIISMFIFTGDFKDPFKEFFVEKLYRRVQGGDGSVNTSDFMFKMSAQPEKMIPAFFIEIATLIFKTGCSVHLLKRKNLKCVDQEQLMQYFSICCGDSINKFVMKLQSRDLGLNFEVSQLRLEQEERSKFFDQQLQKLQEIELRIVQQEEELYYRQVILREEARREYLLKRQLEEEKEIKMEQDRKDAFMRDIQIQIEEKKQRKEKERDQLVQENLQVRREQDEYDRKKKAIEEELKRVYLETMRENQKLGDMRSEDIKQKELMEKEVQKLIDEKERYLQEEQTPKAAMGGVQVEEVKGEDAMEIDTLQKDEAQFLIDENKIENTEELIKKQQLSNQSQFQEQISIPQEVAPLQSEQIDESQLLTLDEIKLISLVEESPPQESIEDKLKLISELFIQPLMKNIFERINEKKLMENKRRTWMQKRKEERIVKAQEKKTVWKYQEPEISVKQKIDSIFRQFEECQTKEKREQFKNEALAQSGETNKAPTALAIRQCVISVIKDQNKIVNQCLLHMMYRRLQLLKHLEVLKKFYFCNQGDIISLFMQSIFNDDFDSTVKENSISFINNQLDISIRLSLPYSSNEQTNDIFSVNSLLGNFSFELINEQGIVKNPNFFFTAFNISDYIWLNYKRFYPLDMAISHQCIQKYNTILFFLLKLKRINQILSHLWKYLSSSEFKNLEIEEYARIRRIQTLRARMQYFITMMEEYALTEVIESLWTTFKESLSQINQFEDLIKYHNDFLDQIMVKCFIDRKDHKVMGQITQMFGFVLQFNKIVKEYGIDVCKDKEALKQIIQIDTSFKKYTEFLYQLVKHLAYKGQFKELFLRLDFNKFYEK